MRLTSRAARRLASGVPAAVVAALALTSAPPAHAETVRPGYLPSGPAPTTLTWLADHRIHPAGRAWYRLDTDLGDRSYLLGRAPGSGWLVVRQMTSGGDAVTDVMKVQNAVSQRLVRASAGGDLVYAGYRVSQDRTRVVRIVGDRGGTAFTTFSTVTGEQQQERGPDFDERVIGTRGSSFLMSKYVGGTSLDTRLYEWPQGAPPAAVVPAVTNPREVYPAKDLVVVGPYGPVGPQALSKPQPPPWRAPFTSMAVSPGKRFVAGTRVGGDGRTLQVRRLSDGAIVRSFTLPRPIDGTVAFEDDRTVLFQGGTTSGKSALVRCVVAGTSHRCERVSGFVRFLSFEDESHIWGPTPAED